MERLNENIDNEVSLDKEDVKAIEKRYRKEGVLGLRQDRLQRKELADKVYNLICCYLVGVFALLLLSGCENHFHLSEAVLLALLGTTTANVLAILAIVVLYFFHKKEKQ